MTTTLKVVKTERFYHGYCVDGVVRISVSEWRTYEDGSETRDLTRDAMTLGVEDAANLSAEIVRTLGAAIRRDAL